MGDEPESPMTHEEYLVSDLDIAQNHLNETYFIEKDKEYREMGGRPILTLGEYEKFEKKLKEESAVKGQQVEKGGNSDRSQSLFSASLPL